MSTSLSFIGAEIIIYAQRVTIIAVIILILHGIPYVVFYEHVVSSTTNQITCINTNHGFDQYRGFVNVPLLFGFLPIVIAALFGSMACRNVQEMAYRTVPLVRSELEKQLTVMVLVQGAVNMFAMLPYTTVIAIATYTDLTDDPIFQAKVQFASTVTFIIACAYFASPFYIYICASERFRRQLIYALFKIHLNR